MKLLLENWRKYLEETTGVPLFYRAENTNTERIKQLIDSIGKQYPRSGKGFFGSYISEKPQPMYMYGAGGQPRTPIGAIIEFEVNDIEIDEAVLDTNVLPWLNVKDSKHQQVLIRNFSPKIKDYFSEIAKAQEKFYDAKLASAQLAAWMRGEYSQISPNEMTGYPEAAVKALTPVVEKIRTDKDIVAHWLKNGPQNDWIEGGNFRMPGDGDGTKITKVQLYRLGEKAGEETEITPEEALKDEKNSI